ncbi:DVUA0089 family protein [Nitrosovibrio sp. Nv6]|uniref:DVUA0089 family protein n=1 Tax=Nitrosovibrio sp. Nv6 TaxID=1855340 RepID=UPI00115F7C8B|nr:DVUA0089 family protein [Nitrosovibrio sp. Nv6]
MLQSEVTSNPNHEENKNMVSDKAHVLDSATPVARMRKDGLMERLTLTVGRASLTSIVVLSLLLLGKSSYATTFTEIGDTGNLPGTAQIASVVGLLTEIHGTLSPADGDAQDMYLIHIAGSGTFSATTVGGIGFDSELFLFDASGKGVYANDDVASRDFAPSTLPAGNPLTPITAGDYYLAITQCCSAPISSGGQIFTIAGPNHRALSGPTGAGGDSPVTGYSGGFVQIPTLGGPYQIFLTGAHFTGTHAAVVSEPHTFALMLAGLGMMGFIGRHHRKIKSKPS